MGLSGRFALAAILDYLISRHLSPSTALKPMTGNAYISVK
jgi:hypothetical protein